MNLALRLFVRETLSAVKGEKWPREPATWILLGPAARLAVPRETAVAPGRGLIVVRGCCMLSVETIMHLLWSFPGGKTAISLHHGGSS